jgi:hypothetical protein
MDRQETPRHSIVQEEQVDDDGVSAHREGDDEKKSEEDAIPSDGDRLPEPKTLDPEQSERVVHKKDVKVKRDPSSTAVRPGAVAVPGLDATATTRTARKPSGMVPQTDQLLESSECSEDQDIESGLLVPASGMLDEQTESARSGGFSSGDEVRPGAAAVQPGTTITTQNAETLAFPAPAMMHASSHSILASKAAIANRTAAAKGRADSDGATGVTDGAHRVSESSLDEDESGALLRTENNGYVQ